MPAQTDPANVVYLLALLAMIAMSIAARRIPMREAVRNILIWVAIVLAGLLIVMTLQHFGIKFRNF